MTIQEILDNILHAVFGRDVRQSMHDGVKRANDVADETKTRQDDLEVKYDQLLDNFSSASPSDAEIVDARVGIDGTTYASLKRRIDSEAADRYTKEEVYSKEEAYNKEEVYNKEEAYNKEEVYTRDEIFNVIYPVGSIYMSAVGTNPKDLFGGEWSAWGSGRVPVGVSTSETEFKTVEKTGGEKTHTIKIEETPYITARGNFNLLNLSATTGTKFAYVQEILQTHPHNNLQPYITCYMWKRTA
ncbi:MAG: hypothetical protein PHT76_10640 [Anaerostipes sp.]|nr:hypothetical protein [Anaerostipes sp.]